MEFSVTNIQLFDLTRQEIDSNENVIDVIAYSANLTINDSFIVQVSGSLEEACRLTIPNPNLGQYWHDESAQMFAYENIDPEDIEREIEGKGFENNFYWIQEHADEIA